MSSIHYIITDCSALNKNVSNLTHRKTGTAAGNDQSYGSDKIMALYYWLYSRRQ